MKQISLWTMACVALVRAAQCQGMQWSREFELQGPSNIVDSMTVYDDGSGPTLVVGGQFGSIQPGGSWPSPRIARWDGAAWSPIGNGFDDYVNSVATYQVGGAEVLFAGGYFDLPFRALALWDGSTWSAPWNSPNQLFGSSESIHVMQQFNGELYIGGEFQYNANIVRWDGTAMRSVGGGCRMGAIPNGAFVRTMCVFDDGTGPQLYITGIFTHVGTLPARGWARWNGTAWSQVGNGILPSRIPLATVVYDDGMGPALYCGTSMDETYRYGLVKWDGHTWSSVGDSPQAGIKALAVFDDGSGPKIYAWGPFIGLASGETVRIARLEGNSWVSLGSGSPHASSGGAWNMAVFDPGPGPRLYFGTGRWNVGGISSLQLAAWVASTGPISSVCPGDGALRACPCTPNGAIGRGCSNSAQQSGALLAATGSVAGDDLTLNASDMRPSSAVLFLQSDGYNAYAPRFGDGLRCLAGTQIRLRTASAQGGAAQVPEPGAGTLRARIHAGGDPLPSGAVRYYQAFYRDAVDLFCSTGGTFNATNGLRIVW